MGCVLWKQAPGAGHRYPASPRGKWSLQKGLAFQVRGPVPVRVCGALGCQVGVGGCVQSFPRQEAPGVKTFEDLDGHTANCSPSRQGSSYSSAHLCPVTLRLGHQVSLTARLRAKMCLAPTRSMWLPVGARCLLCSQRLFLSAGSVHCSVPVGFQLSPLLSRL